MKTRTRVNLDCIFGVRLGYVQQLSRTYDFCFDDLG